MIEDSIQEFRKNVDLNPGDTEARYDLAYAYEGKGMIDEAMTEYRKAIHPHSVKKDELNTETANKNNEQEKVMATFDKHDGER